MSHELCRFSDFFPFHFLSPSSSDDEIKFIRSQKNKPQLLYRGYVFNKKTTYQNGNVAWRCADISKFKCPASCIVNGTRFTRSRLEHNHVSRKATYSKKDVFLSEQELDKLFSVCIEAKESE